jgi:hypothetical protein
MPNSDVARTADRIEIRDLLSRYCRAIQGLDVDELAAVFQPDALIDKGPGAVRIDEYIPDVIVRNSHNLRAALQVTNVIVDFLGENSAFVETSGVEFAHLPNPTGEGLVDNIYWVRYGDIVDRREDGAWRIAKRRLVIDHIMSWPSIDPESKGFLAPEGFLAGRFVGRRNSDDPIRQLRSELS